MPSSPSDRLRDYTKLPFEIFVLLLTILPFLALAYFYPVLPQRIPLFLNLRGEVVTWVGKSLLSVFRVPLLAADTQLVCLLMKYATVRSSANAPLRVPAEETEYRKQYLRLNAGLWDWFRCLVAFKMSAASADTIFLSLDRFKFLSRPAFAITAIAALLSIAGALFYGYRMLLLRREMRKRFGSMEFQNRPDERRVYAGVLYFNPSDPAIFVRKYMFNFADKCVWILIVCLIAYPLLVFSQL